MLPGSGTDFDIWYKFYNSTSETWSPLQLVSNESNIIALTPHIAIDNENNIHITWYDETDLLGAGTDSDIFHKTYNTTTDTWSAYQLVSNESTSNSESPVIAIDSENNIHTTWRDNTSILGAGTDYDIFYKSYNSTSNTWTPYTLISNESTSTSQRPEIAADSENNIHITWSDDTDIYYQFYNITSNTWSPLQLVSNESTTSAAMGEIVVDSEDNLHITWYDSTNILGAGTDQDQWYQFYKQTKPLP